MNVLRYIEGNPGVFYAVVAGISLYSGVGFYLGGRRAERRFRDGANQRILFREKGASGHSKQSLRTRFGGASRVLDVIVTEHELWLKGIWPMFTYIGSKYDLTHRVLKTKISKVRTRSHDVEIWFENERGTESHIELRLKDVPAFTSALGAQQIVEADT